MYLQLSGWGGHVRAGTRYPLQALSPERWGMGVVFGQKAWDKGTALFRIQSKVFPEPNVT